MKMATTSTINHEDIHQVHIKAIAVDALPLFIYVFVVSSDFSCWEKGAARDFILKSCEVIFPCWSFINVNTVVAPIIVVAKF